MVKQKWFKNEDVESADTPPRDQKIMKKKQRKSRSQNLNSKQNVHQISVLLAQTKLEVIYIN